MLYMYALAASSLDMFSMFLAMECSLYRRFNQKPGNTTILRFAWDTSGVPPGTYIIKAMADVDYEILESNEENNNCISATYIKVVIHDVAVTSQVPYPTVVIQGELVTINVTVTNEGTETESFTVNVYYYGEIECCANQAVTLASGETRTLTFEWNTAGIPPGTYYIEARALPVEGELDTEDNTCISTAAVTVVRAPVGGIIVPQESISPITLNATALAITAAITVCALIIVARKRLKT